MNLSFIGPRGVGKSKISRKLSKMTGIPVVSTDMIAVYETGGLSIPEFIQKNKGNWRAFRELEFRILEKIQNSTNLLVDCGGGILFDLDESGNEIPSDRKISILKRMGKVIRLDADLQYLASKVKQDSNRPSLSSTESYIDILRRRTVHYTKAADISISIEGKDPESVARNIMEFFPDLRRRQL